MKRALPLLSLLLRKVTDTGLAAYPRRSMKRNTPQQALQPTGTQTRTHCHPVGHTRP